MQELERLPWREVQEWEIYLDSHPPDAEVLDWQMATLLTLVAGIAMKSPPPPKEWSLYERLRPRTKEEVSAEVKRMFANLTD